MAKDIKSIRDLRPQRRNANRHTQRGLGLLEDSVQELGWIGAMTVAADGEAFDGSARLEVGAAAGFGDAIVVRSDGSRPIIHVREDIPTADDPKAVKLGVAANRIAAIDLDFDAEVLASIVEDGIDLSDLFTADEFTELLGDTEPEPGGGGDEFDAVPDEGQTRVKVGDLWQCGRHRVLCGDSTKREDVERLMQGEKAVLMATDPPYGVDVAGGTHDPRDTKNYRSGATVENDKLTGAKLRDFLCSVFNVAKAHMVEGASWYLWHSAIETRAFVEAADALGGMKHVLVWVKPNFVFGRSDYHYKHESILYGWLPGAGHKWYGDRTQDSVWQATVGEDLEKKMHPTSKPVVLLMAPITNHSKEGEVCYEPFLGSGTTLIAAERTGRKCYGIEISPKYCDVVLKRYTAETGQEPQLIDRIS